MSLGTTDDARIGLCPALPLDAAGFEQPNFVRQSHDSQRLRRNDLAGDPLLLSLRERYLGASTSSEQNLQLL